MIKAKGGQTVLALYPNRFGISYALFDNPEDLVEVGNGYIRPTCNKKALERAKKYLDYYRPSIVITRKLNDLKGSSRSKRIEALIEKICKAAGKKNLQVHQYSRTEIIDVFNQFQAKTKYQIMKCILNWYKELDQYEIPKRKEWMSDKPNTGIFDAVSLAMTHYFLE